MSWGLILNGITLTGVTRDRLLAEKEECEYSIDNYVKRLIAIGAYTLPVHSESDGNGVVMSESLIDYVAREIPMIVEDLREEAVKLFLVNHAINNESSTVDDI
jgi:hypothetical protein